MTGRRLPAHDYRPAATALYALGLLALFAVAASLGGGETEPARWALVAVPVTLFAAASLAMRRARRSARRSGDVGEGRELALGALDHALELDDEVVVGTVARAKHDQGLPAHRVQHREHGELLSGEIIDVRGVAAEPVHKRSV